MTYCKQCLKKQQKMKKLVYYLQRKRCPKCLYSNQLLTHVATQHYIYGNTLANRIDTLSI